MTKAVCCFTGTWNSSPVPFSAQYTVAEEETPALSAVLLSSSLLQLENNSYNTMKLLMPHSWSSLTLHLQVQHWLQVSQHQRGDQAVKHHSHTLQVFGVFYFWPGVCTALYYTAQIFQRVSPSLTITCCSGDILPSRFLFCSLEIHYVPGCTKVIWSVPLKAPCSVPNPTLDTLTQIGTWKLIHTAESSVTVKLLFTAACQNI